MWYKDINIQGVYFRIKLADDHKHKYVSWLISKTDNNNNVLLTRPVKFGAYGMEHYRDKLGYYKNLNHNDEKRLKNFRNRFKSSYMKYVDVYKNDIMKMTKSPLYWSWTYLW